MSTVIRNGARLARPLVYDATEVRLLVARNFEVTVSTDYAPAFRTDSIALRISGRFNAAIPVAAKALRKLAIGGTGETVAAKKTAPASRRPKPRAFLLAW